VRRWPAKLARAAAAGLVACLAAAPAAARPLTVEDVLRMEGLGRVEIAPGGRWLALERRSAYAATARFDFDRFNNLFRTRLMASDVAHGGALAPLVAPEPGVGYALGPFSPDGARVAVFRLKDGRWELGLVTLATHAVWWTGITPDIPAYGRTVQWSGRDRLLVLALPDHRLPFAIRWFRPQARLPLGWAAERDGAGAHTLVGAGAYLGERPHDPPARLLLIDPAARTMRPLAEGGFIDLEASPNGAWAALLEEGPDIPMHADQDLYRESNLIFTRLRLKLVDLRRGGARVVCAGCDMLSQLLAWAPSGETLLVYARRDGQAWADGRLFQVTAATGAMRDLSTQIRPAVVGRPETVVAGWMGQDPIVYGEPGSAEGTRRDWWRLGPTPRRLTAALPEFALYGAAAGPRRLVVQSRGRLVALDRAGRVREVVGPIRPPPFPTEGPLSRFGLYLAEAERLEGVLDGRAGAVVFELGQSGPRRGGAAPAGADLLAGDAAGALVRQTRGGGEDVLAWAAPGMPPRPLLVLNAHLAEVEPPRLYPVRHRGPEGQPLTSWIVAPHAPAGAPPPPLVVFPYLNLSHPTPPAFLDPRNSPGIDMPLLLAGHGYAVLLPSLPVPHDGRAPSDHVAEHVLSIIAAAAAAPQTRGLFDPTRLAVAGDSFGAYSTIAIITQTDRFKAAATWAAMPDLISKWGDFGPTYRSALEHGLPNPQWVEGIQGEMQGPPWRTLDRYLAGSPFLHLDRATTPLLLGHGELDNFSVSQSEQTFSAYLRQNRDAELVTYWGEGHRLRSPGNLRDFYARLFAWFDRYLGVGASSPPGSERPQGDRALDDANGPGRGAFELPAGWRRSSPVEAGVPAGPRASAPNGTPPIGRTSPPRAAG